MPTARDYLIATLMGENNRGTVQSQQGVLDTIFNRLSDPTQYGAASGASIQGIVQGRTRNGGYQYDAWRPQINGKSNGQYALTTAALNGRDSLSGLAQTQYDQAARVVDDFMNNGVGRGITQGSTFYQTPNAPNSWQRDNLWPKYGRITVGDHIYSGPSLVQDMAEYQRQNPGMFTSQQAPAFTQDGFGAIVDPSKGYNNGGGANFGDFAGMFQTLPYGESPNGGPGDALGVGNGSLGGGVIPNMYLSRPGDYNAIASLYQYDTGRSPDADGANYWMKELSNGKSLFDIEKGIQSSTEGQSFLSNNARGQIASMLVPTLDTGTNTGTINTGTETGTIGGGTETGTIGNPAFSPTINNWYEGILQRPPDAQGGQNYQNLLDAGVSPNIIEAQILNSGEAAQTLGPDKLASLLNNYQTVNGISAQDAATLSPFASEFAQATGRGMDVGTQQWWDSQVKAGTPQSLLEAQILSAPEAIQARTGNLDSLSNAYSAKYGLSPTDVSTLAPLAGEFQQLTGRAIDTPTLQDWGRQTAGGTPLSMIEAGLLGAPEVQQARTGSLDDLTSQYQAKYGLTPTEVNTLSPLASQFQQATGRGVDTPTLQWWNSQLDAGTPQSILQAQLLTAPEVQARGPDATASLVNDYQTQYGLKPQEVATLAPLASQFSQLLGRPVDTPTLQNWDAQIDAGTSMPTLQAQLLQAPEVTARTGGTGDLYDAFQTQNGRSAADYLSGLSNPNGFSGLNTSGGLGKGTFSGTFDPTQYLAANPDVKASGMDPLTHYLTYGYNEGRAIDPKGDKINQGFDPAAYLKANPDVAAAHVDPLFQFITTGASEGRALPTGSNPYSFTGLNVGGYQAPSGGGGGASLTATTASGAANGLQGSGGAGGSAFGYTDSSGKPQISTFNPQGSELAYLNGQTAEINQRVAAGQSATMNNFNEWNNQLGQAGQQITQTILGGWNPALTGGLGNNPYLGANPLQPVLPGGLNSIPGFNAGGLGGPSFLGRGGFL